MNNSLEIINCQLVLGDQIVRFELVFQPLIELSLWFALDGLVLNAAHRIERLNGTYDDCTDYSETRSCSVKKVMERGQALKLKALFASSRSRPEMEWRTGLTV